MSHAPLPYPASAPSALRDSERPRPHLLAALLPWASWRMPLVHVVLGVALWAHPFVGWVPKLALAAGLHWRIQRHLTRHPEDAFAQQLRGLCRSQGIITLFPDLAVAGTCALIGSTEPALVFLGLYNFGGFLASALLAGVHHRALRRLSRGTHSASETTT